MRAVLLATLGLILGGTVALTPSPGRAQDAEEARQRLDELRTAIDRLSEARRREESRKNQLQAKLRETEKSLGRLQAEIRATDTDIGAAQESIAELSQRQTGLNNSAEAQRDAVRAALRDAYKNGDRGQLRMLLGEEDPQELARLMTYYRYIVEARADLIAEFRATIAELASVEADLDARLAGLEEKRAQQKNRLARLESSRRERREVLAQIETALATQSAELAQREAEERELEALLSEIESAIAQLMPEEDVEPFTAAQGRMPWPVRGRILFGFGRPRAQGKMRWQGVRMQADAGDPVTAIHHGRVVYADWLRGSGLLLVIDHGEGYMSLYAHNESLLRQVGDWVGTGTPVATVGDTGGQSEAGLYFEIRKDGRPTNPARWCQG